MKFLSFIILSALFLVSCQSKAVDTVEVGNPSIEGTVSTQSGTPVKMIESDKEWDSGISKLEVRDEFDAVKEVSKFANLKLKPKESLRLKFERQPNSIEVYVIDKHSNKEKIDLKGATMNSSNLKGYYVYQLDVYWDEGIKNYAFDVDVE